MKQLKRDLDQVSNHLKQMSELNGLIVRCVDTGAMTAAYENALELERLSESCTLYARELPCEFGVPNAVGCVEMIIRDSVLCDIGFTDEGWFRLSIPILLPKKSRKGTVDYIRGTLYPPMTDFFRTNPVKRLDDCVIVFRHVYDRNTPEKRRRDHDNIEIKQVTDIVAWFTMTDDGPGVCSHFYCSAEGERNKTEVYVVPGCDFPKWLAKYRNDTRKTAEK